MVLAGPTSTAVGPIADEIQRRDLDALLTQRERGARCGGGRTHRARDRGPAGRPRADGDNHLGRIYGKLRESIGWRRCGWPPGPDL